MNKVNIFGENQAAELKEIEGRAEALKTQAFEIDGGRTSLKVRAQNKLQQLKDAIQNIDNSQIPEHYAYIRDAAERADNLARKAPLEVERDQTQAEYDALKKELEQIQAAYTQLEAEMAPLVVLKAVQEKLDKNWPMIIAAESALKTTTEIGPDLLVGFIAPLIDASCDCREKLQPQLERNRKLDAKAIKADYDTFTEAGFSSAQAMELTLARVKMNTMQSLLLIAASANSSSVLPRE